MKDFDPAGLDCLAALADEASFERAAQRLAITQSAVSQRLRALEASVGQPLVVRTRPLRLTASGKVLLRYARQWQALRADASEALGSDTARHRLPIAVNADSLATWVLPALDPIVQRLPPNAGLELIVDDEDFTHERLRDGAVLGCVSTVREALRGCHVQALGAMHYVAVASPAFIERELPHGLGRANFAQVPFLVFDRKDDMQVRWVERAFGVREPRLNERFVPSSDVYVRAVQMGWGIGIVPKLQLNKLASSAVQVLHPDVTLPVALYWHHWQGAGEAPGLLERVGAALVDGAQQVLVQARTRKR